jgi:uncharacterized repeat protein (TIGR02543 family)
VGTLPIQPERTGYVFAGWNTAANGSGSPFTGSTAVAANLPVYAQWDKNLSNTNVSLLSIVGKLAGDQNVRTGPTTGFPVATVLLANDLVHIVKIDADSRWMVVEYARDTIAYTSNLYMDAVLSSRVGKVLANTYVYTATTGNNKLGVIEKNSFVLIIEKDVSGNWFKILYDGKSVGYIATSNVLIPRGVVDTVTSSPNVSVVNRAASNNPGLHNYPGKRGPAAYNQIINQFNIGQNTPNGTGGYTTTTYNARYNQSRDTSGNVTATYCNIFNWDVMTAMGVHFPHWGLPNGTFAIPVSGRVQIKTPYIPPPGTVTGTGGHYELTANMLYEWMKAYGKDYGWTEVGPTIAQNRANNGFPTITVWRHNSDSSSGHVQVVRPETSSFPYSSANSCVVAQAGSVNFNYGNVRTSGMSYTGGIPVTPGSTYALKYYTHDIDLANGSSDPYNQPEKRHTIDPADPGM